MSERCPAWPASTKTRGASASQLRRADQRSVCAACITKGHDGEEQTSAQGGRCCRRDKRLGAPAFDRACPTRSRKRFCVHGPAETPPWPNLAQKNELQVLWGAGPHLIAHGGNSSQQQPTAAGPGSRMQAARPNLPTVRMHGKGAKTLLPHLG